MRILLASDKNYEKYLKHIRGQLSRLGYKSDIYDLGELGYGKEFSDYFDGKRVKGIRLARFKPHMIRDYLKTADEFFTYLDVDAEVLERFDEVEGDYDVGIIVRPDSDLGRTWANRKTTGYLMGGTMFFYPNDKARKFVDMWIEQMEKEEDRGDQLALYYLLQDCGWEMLTTYMLGDIKVKLFPAEIYCWHRQLEMPRGDAKILQYPGDQIANLNVKL